MAEPAVDPEAYTIAILLAELLGVDDFRQRVKVYATDVDDAAMATARLARYRRAAVEPLDRLDPALVPRHFTDDGDTVTLRPRIRGAVIFGLHDVVQDAPISRVDLLLCRNLLVDLQHRLFRTTQAAGPRATVRTSGSAGVLGRVAQAAFASAPDAQIVLDPDGTVRVVNDSAVRRLGVAHADVGRAFAELPLSSTPVQLVGPVAVATVENRVVELSQVPSIRDDGQRIWYDVRVAPLAADGAELLGIQVTFRDVTRHRQLDEELQVASGELANAFAELQTFSEELETTNEELQCAVEELETTNEELESTNEELETMNEELQSTNEELQTLNDELRERTGEVNQVNAFLESILTGLRGGVVVVDRDLVVRVWNEQAEQMWGLREFEAQGRPFLNLDVGLPVDRLRQALQAVVDGAQPLVEMALAATNRLGRPVLCQVTCSPLRDGHRQVSGAIVLLAESALQESAG